MDSWAKRSEAAAPPGNEALDPAALADLLIIHRHDLFRIEDERIRSLEAQAGAVATIALAAVAVSAPVFERAVDRDPPDVAVLVLCVISFLLAILTVISSLFARAQYPRPLRRRGDHHEAVASDLPSILASRGSPEQVRPHIAVADNAVQALGHVLRSRYGGIYARRVASLDKVSTRLRILDAWDLRYLSATQRARRKRAYLNLAFVLVVVELVIAGVALLLAG
jgi:hypothetical protein